MSYTDYCYCNETAQVGLCIDYVEGKLNENLNISLKDRNLWKAGQ